MSVWPVKLEWIGAHAAVYGPSNTTGADYAEPDDRDSGGVRVRFDGDSGRSQVEAWWDRGPQDRVEEQGDGGSGPG